MQEKLRWLRPVVLLLATVLLCTALTVSTVQAATYQKGSSGSTVRTIQTKLKRWGYYTGSVDGIYGSKTVAAIKHFQRNNGLTADGVCGPATLQALGINSGTATSSRDNDLYLLARMITAEARGEPYSGQVAVGAVILNRVASPSFPNTIAGVIYQKGAFSALDDGQFHSVTITDSCRRAAQDALNGTDPTGGALYYYNPAKTTNKWIYSRPTICTIGKHVFAK
jgi:N-acetylmuramoyl-L-alanine amidase